VNNYFLFAYIKIYRQFYKFNKILAIRFEHQLKEEDVLQINKTIREVKWIFILIAQMLFIQTIYFLSTFLQDVGDKALWSERLKDIILTVVQFSTFLMYISFSYSVKRAFKAHIRKVSHLSKQN
jgi:hypothetical protein